MPWMASMSLQGCTCSVSSQRHHQPPPQPKTIRNSQADGLECARSQASGIPMNYRHSFHAGNHADVLKHAVLLRMLTLMQRKESPLCYLDSHAGTALYDLLGEDASRTGEYLDGIGRLWSRDDLPPLLADY